MKKKRISLLNFEGDVFNVIRNYDSLFDIIDYKNQFIKTNISANTIMLIFDGFIKIQASDGKIYDLSKEHPNAKPKREDLLNFLGIS